MKSAQSAALGALATIGLVASLVSTAAAPAQGQAAAPLCEGERATIVGTARGETLRGTDRRDVIVSRGGNDTVRGRGGDDVICASAGADTVHGGPGRDRLHGGKDRHGTDRAGTYQIGDTLHGGPGNDVMDGGFDDPARSDQVFQRDRIDYRESARGVVADLGSRVVTGQGRDTVRASTNLGFVGSAHDDTIRGTAGDDLVVGMAGDDLVHGGDGADELYAEDMDLIDPPHDHDEVHGGAGNDLIDSAAGRDVLHGDAGADGFSSYSSRSVQIHGGEGNDSASLDITKDRGTVIDPGAGHDDLTLGSDLPPRVAARTWVRADAGAGTIRIGDGAIGELGVWQDVTFMTRTKVSYRGTDAPEAVTALTAEPLRAWTFGGDDDIFGSLLADHLDAGDGDDRVRALAGRDTCVDAERATSCEQ